jgi:hypothetical protein
MGPVPGRKIRNSEEMTDTQRLLTAHPMSKNISQPIVSGQIEVGSIEIYHAWVLFRVKKSGIGKK